MWTFNKKFEVVDDDTSFKCQNKYESVSEILEVTRKGQCCLGDSWGIDTEKKEVNAKKKKFKSGKPGCSKHQRNKKLN